MFNFNPIEPYLLEKVIFNKKEFGFHYMNKIQTEFHNNGNKFNSTILWKLELLLISILPKYNLLDNYPKIYVIGNRKRKLKKYLIQSLN